jgi:hypothetical protein
MLGSKRPNIVVKDAWWQMLFLVYAAVALLSLITFRSWRAVLAEALMVMLGMGVKVATLPVIALGGWYRHRLRAVHPLGDPGAVARRQEPVRSVLRALLFTGKVVMLTGVTLAFMFLWNMLGALILLPALAHFLLKPEPLTAASEEASPADALQSEPASEPLRSSQVTPA